MAPGNGFTNACAAGLVSGRLGKEWNGGRGVREDRSISRDREGEEVVLVLLLVLATG